MLRDHGIEQRKQKLKSNVTPRQEKIMLSIINEKAMRLVILPRAPSKNSRKNIGKAKRPQTPFGVMISQKDGK